MTTLLVDGNNLGIAAHFGADVLTDMQGRPVGAIFGFIRMLRAILERTQLEQPTEPISVIVAWDAKPSWREEKLPEYKESRTKNRTPEMEKALQDYADQVPRLRQLLATMGVNQIKAALCEADDIAGWMTQRQANWILVSGDKDWLQLIRPNVKVWQPSKTRYVGMENFSEVTAEIVGSKSGICCSDAADFVDMLAIAGDTGDDVPGVDGVGYAKALQFMTGQMKASSKTYKKIEEWKANPDGYERSKMLVDLRTMAIPMQNVQLMPGAFNPEAFMNECITYGFESILKQINEWLRPFWPTPTVGAAA